MRAHSAVVQGSELGRPARPPTVGGTEGRWLGSAGISERGVEARATRRSKLVGWVTPRSIEVAEPTAMAWDIDATCRRPGACRGDLCVLTTIRRKRLIGVAPVHGTPFNSFAVFTATDAKKKPCFAKAPAFWRSCDPLSRTEQNRWIGSELSWPKTSWR